MSQGNIGSGGNHPNHPSRRAYRLTLTLQLALLFILLVAAVVLVLLTVDGSIDRAKQVTERSENRIVPNHTHLTLIHLMTLPHFNQGDIIHLEVPGGRTLEPGHYRASVFLVDAKEDEVKLILCVKSTEHIKEFVQFRVVCIDRFIGYGWIAHDNWPVPYHHVTEKGVSNDGYKRNG